ncbi:Uncharacterised protein [Mycobacteroides abscessus subsp. abscessus]|nr:Uncharacterised protein [Mycobacteroides abscessus subsp. abscessus]
MVTTVKRETRTSSRTKARHIHGSRTQTISKIRRFNGNAS